MQFRALTILCLVFSAQVFAVSSASGRVCSEEWRLGARIDGFDVQVPVAKWTEHGYRRCRRHSCRRRNYCPSRGVFHFLCSKRIRSGDCGRYRPNRKFRRRCYRSGNCIGTCLCSGHCQSFCSSFCANCIDGDGRSCLRPSFSRCFCFGSGFRTSFR